MRTKTLLLTAALGAAGIVTSMAQVYSVNAVGYVNKSVPLNTASAVTYAILANPLNGTNNNINTVLPTAPDNTLLNKFSGGSFEDAETFIAGVGWLPGTTTLNPGEAFFVTLDSSGAQNPVVFTFVGEVPQGNLVNPVANGYSLISSIVPQTGLVSADLGLAAPDNSLISTWNVANQSYDDAVTFINGVGWLPAEPTIPVGEGFFFLNPTTAFDWTRNFSVN